MMGTMYEEYQELEYRRSASGLYIPAGQWKEINETFDHFNALEKAQRSPTEERLYQEWRRKMGSVVSTLHQAVYYNMSSYGASDKPPGTVSHRTLREVAKKSAIDAAIINARRIQVSHVAKRVIVQGKEKGFNVVHKRSSDPEFKNTPAVQKTCRDIEDMVFERINRDIHGSAGFRDFMVKVIQDELIVDRKCLIVQRDRRNRPLQYHTIPPDDVKPRLEVLLKYIPGITPMQRGAMTYHRVKPDDMERARDAIFAQFGVDVTNAVYVQEVDNIIMGAWSAEEMSIDITAPVNELNIGFYGQSCLERSLEISALLMNAFNQNSEIFNQEMPDVFMILNGEVTPTGLEEFKRKIKAEGKRTRIGILAAGDAENKAEILKVRDTPVEMQMQQMIRLLTALKASGGYRAHPSIIGLSPDRGTDSNVIANYNDAFEIDLSQEEGLGSLLENTAGWLTREMVEPVAEWAEYQVVPEIPKLQTEKEILELWSQKSEQFCTVDTALAAMGLPSLAEQTKGKVNGAYINNSFFFQAQQAQQAEMQQDLQNMMMGGPQFDDQALSEWTTGDDHGDIPEGKEEGWT